MVQHIAIVGAALAGLRLLEALRREGYGGRVTMIGAEAALPYDRPPLSKQFLVEGWPEEKLALSRTGVAPLEAEWRLGQKATSLDPNDLAALDALRDRAQLVIAKLPRNLREVAAKDGESHRLASQEWAGQHENLLETR